MVSVMENEKQARCVHDVFRSVSPKDAYRKMDKAGIDGFTDGFTVAWCDVKNCRAGYDPAANIKDIDKERRRFREVGTCVIAEIESLRIKREQAYAAEKPKTLEQPDYKSVIGKAVTKVVTSKAVDLIHPPRNYD